MNNMTIANKVADLVDDLVEQLELNPNVVYNDSEKGKAALINMIVELEDIKYAFYMDAEEKERNI